MLFVGQVLREVPGALLVRGLVGARHRPASGGAVHSPGRAGTGCVVPADARWLWLLGWSVSSSAGVRVAGCPGSCCSLPVTGWGAITRPLTMIAFVIPVAVIVIRDTFQSGRWGQLGAALVVGVAFLMIVPLQNARILGKWNRTPLGRYTRQYLPFDKDGVRLRFHPAALRAGFPILETSYASCAALHREHQPGALPGILFERLKKGAMTDFGRSRRFLVPVAVLGVLVLPVAGWLGVATASLLYLVYLGYAPPLHVDGVLRGGHSRSPRRLSRSA